MAQYFVLASIVDPETKLNILLELQAGPSHGYELADNLEISKGYVYVHFREIKEEELIEIAEAENSGRQRTTYRLTENGDLLLQALGHEIEE